jgi:hypothetical protein
LCIHRLPLQVQPSFHWVPLPFNLWIHWPILILIVPAEVEAMRGCLPVSIMKGVCCINKCTWLLCVNSAEGSRSSQLSWHWVVKIPRYPLSSWLKHSVWPSVCGW